jgi:hypothetical protein
MKNFFLGLLFVILLMTAVFLVTFISRDNKTIKSYSPSPIPSSKKIITAAEIAQEIKNIKENPKNLPDCLKKIVLQPGHEDWLITTNKSKTNVYDIIKIINDQAYRIGQYDTSSCAYLEKGPDIN